MDTQARTRSCLRQPPTPSEQTPRGSKQICLPMTREDYDAMWDDARKVRSFLDRLIGQSPELFPEAITDGYQLAGRLPASAKMPGIRLRQLRIGAQAYTLRPSFVFAYMTGTVAELEHPLLLLALGVPCWVVTKIFGHNDMFWQRHLERLGRASLVGTTVRDPDRLPEHVAADEHHVDWCGDKGYVAFTAAGGCVLGIGLTEAADEEHLTQAYGTFAKEARQVNPDYAPQTVNTDGWWATGNAWQALFARVVVILCFLHGFLKIRDRCRKERELHRRIWEVYQAPTAEAFRTQMAAFRTWFASGSWSAVVTEMVEKLFKRSDHYVRSYDHPECYRTSNQVDRLMNRLTRLAYAGRGLHGHQPTSELRLRGWALLHNFREFAPRSNQKRPFQSPAHRLNQKAYHEHWLHNLQVSASLGGTRGIT
jgi:hypothetical protein